MRSALISLAALLGMALAGCHSTPVHASSGTSQEQIEVGGRVRTYLLHRPNGVSSDQSPPLVLAFHGRGGQGVGMEALTGLSATADAHGFLVAYPDGIGRAWHYGESDIDDIAFTDALIDRLVAEEHVDPSRVYATGLSDGGFFSEFLGCAPEQRVAAIAPVGAELTGLLALRCALVPAIPVEMIVGTDDPIVPWAGSSTFPGRLLSAPETTAFWVGHAGLGAAPSVDEWLPDTAPNDGTRVHHLAYGNGQVDLLAVVGGGHTWPAGLQYLPVQWVGRTSRDFSASETIWQFFESMASN
jgi:polyhydroxybutyrate depolymerase